MVKSERPLKHTVPVRGLLVFGLAAAILGIWMVPGCVSDGTVVPVIPCNKVVISGTAYNIKISGNDTIFNIYVSYTDTVQGIIAKKCTGGVCHEGTNPTDGPRFDTYEGVREQARNGKLICAINKQSGCVPMPAGGAPELSAALKNDIKIWVDAGACP